MSFYQKIIKGEYDDDTGIGMESWFQKCIDFVAEVTGLKITYKKVSHLRPNTGFVVDIPIEGSFIREFGIIMSTAPNSSNYLSSIVFNGELYPLNGYGNFFDSSSFYESNVIVLFTDDILHVLVRLPDEEYHTLFLLNKVTDLSSGHGFWGSLGFIATGRNESCSSCITHNRYDDPDGVSRQIKIVNAETLDGRFRINDLYAFSIPSVCELPEFMPFTVVYEDGTERSAVILGSNSVLDPCGRTLCSGNFISMI